MSFRCRALRGAITIEENTAESICQATEELLLKMVQENDVDIDEIASIIFTLTRDLDAVFPAAAARSLGWNHIPLLCCNEVEVPGSLPRCIRVLMHINTQKSPSELKHIYLRNAIELRQDLTQ
ncbi:MAG: chorismate mutase [Syntrophomonadaceae bacterium]|nr:chorismate mutase [Syntrophomonadaceae bacterium]